MEVVNTARCLGFVGDLGKVLFVRFLSNILRFMSEMTFYGRCHCERV